jgi:hypothetical protein
VSLEIFLIVLRSAPTGSICTWKFDPDKADALHVDYHLGNSKKAQSTFKVKLIPFKDEQFEIPKEQIPDEKHVVNAGELSGTLKKLSEFSNEIEMTLKPSGFKFECVGDFADAEMNMDVLSTTVVEEVHERFSVDYLLWLTKAGSVCENLTVGYKPPALCLEFTCNFVLLRFFLAAKVA